MTDKQKLALIAKRVKETGRYGKMKPVFSEEWGYYLWIMSGKYLNLQYCVKIVGRVIDCLVFVQDEEGKWKGVSKKDLPDLKPLGYDYEYEYYEMNDIISNIEDE